MFDVVIPVSEKHKEQLLVNLNFLYKNLSVDKIILICKKDLFSCISSKLPIEFIDEDVAFYFNINTIKHIIEKRGGDVNKAGWYFQQFVKMEYCFWCDKTYYLVWDADTIPLSKIEFFTKDKKKMLFNRKKEHHIPYFETLDIIFSKNMNYERRSFISEGMIIDSNIMKEMIEIIATNKDLIGNNWVEKIMYAISLRNLDYSGFSEFETYGNYLLNKYPNKYQERPLKTLRNGMGKYGRILNEQELKKLKLDTISFENWDVNQSIIKILCSKFKKYINRYDVQ